MTEPIDILEALLFASDSPVETATIREVLALPSAEAARTLVETLTARLRDEGRALQIMEVGGGFQLVTRPEVAPVRGVNSDAVLDNLLERRLIRIAGRKDSPGRPFLYETTREF